MIQDKVFIPGPNRVFVFGSNEAGIHGAGAARTALEQYGAKWGNGVGLQGNSYAIPTKDARLKTLSINKVRYYITHFLLEANERQDLQFFVTRIGCGLAGFTDAEIGPLFQNAPKNVELPYSWGEPVFEDHYE